MFYSKKEEYNFAFPQEYKAYLEFKHQLHDAGIRFVEEGGSSRQSILISTAGTFDVKDGQIFFNGK